MAIPASKRKKKEKLANSEQNIEMMMRWAYRALEFGPLSSATLDNVLNANVGCPKLLLSPGGRSAWGAAITAAVAVHAVSVGIGMIVKSLAFGRPRAAFGAGRVTSSSPRRIRRGTPSMR